ncbi:hypothetical protein GCM10023350_53220 [Nocardioides endophyticus]|uniref:SCP domain-containing protein n=1 Tax=Nocardioides endophyticus TaxID=1353775 RepID=A0ABP8ZMC7_9ACTN
MTHTSRLTSITATTTTLLLLAVSPAAGSALSKDPNPGSAPDQGIYGQGAITVTRDGWIHYKSELRALGKRAQTVAVIGSREADGSCTSSGSDSGVGSVATTTITVREEVAFNPATCQSEYLVADLTPADGAIYAEAAPPSAETQALGQETKGGEVQAALATYTRWYKTIWEDPIQIDITSETVAQRWNSSSRLAAQHKSYGFNGCVPGGYCPDRTYIDSSANYFGTYSNRFEYSGVSSMHNSTFSQWVRAVLGPAGWAACGWTSSNRADFSHNLQVVGYKTTGNWESHWSDHKSGACTNLVHHDEKTGASWPF